MERQTLDGSQSASEADGGLCSSHFGNGGSQSSVNEVGVVLTLSRELELKRRLWTEVVAVESARQQRSLMKPRRHHDLIAVNLVVGRLGWQAFPTAGCTKWWTCAFFTVERRHISLINQSSRRQQLVGKEWIHHWIVLLPFPTLMPPFHLFLDASEGEAAVHSAEDSESWVASQEAISEHLVLFADYLRGLFCG